MRLQLVFLALLFPVLLVAQSTNDTVFIDEIDVKAHRILEESGMNEVKLDTLLLKKNINASLGEVLSQHSAVFVKNNGRGALSTVSFRGTAASHTDLLWNGLSIKDPMLGQTDFSLLPMFLVDELSLASGGSTIADVSGALGGAIQINNKVDWLNTFSGKLLASVGSYSTYNEFVEIRLGKVNKLQFKSRVFHSYSKNDFKFLNKAIADIDSLTGEYIYPEQRNKGEYKLYGFLHELYWRANERNVLSLKLWNQWSERAIPTLNTYEGDQNSNINTQTDQTHRIAFDWKRYFNNPKLSLTFQSAYAFKELLYNAQNYITGVGFQSFIDSKSKTESLNQQLVGKYSFSSKTILISKYKLEYHNVNTHELIKQTGYVKERFAHSLFVSLHQKITQNLSSSVMLRKEFVDARSLPFIPSLSFEWLLNKKNNLLLKAMLSKNYKQPALNDLYWQPGGNPTLQPEEGIMGEMGFSVARNYKKWQLESSITAYKSNINNWIIWIPSAQGFWTPQNISKVKTLGVESNLTAIWILKKIKFQVNLAYAFSSSLNYGDTEKWGKDAYGKQLPYIPLHSANATFSVFYKGFSLNFLHNSYSERFTTSSNDITQRDWLYPYYMNNLFLAKTLNINASQMEFNFKIYNLFNETYRTILGRAMPKINFLLLVSYRF